jgi:MFS family permease
MSSGREHPAGYSHSYGSVLRLVLPVYLPAFLATLAQKLVVAALPLYVKDELAGDDAAVGAVVSMQGLGAFTTAALAGYTISFIGDRIGMIGGAAIACIAFALCYLVAELPVADLSMLLLACACFGSGIGKSAFEVARNSYMASSVPKELRGRANGLIGGCARVASMLGPALGGLAVHHGGASAAFMAQTLVGAATVAMLIVGMPRGDRLASSEVHVHAPREAEAATSSQPSKRRCVSLSTLVPLLTAGPVGFSFGFVRGARSLLIPLKADSIGLSAPAVGYVTAASFACDTLLFPLGGYISDRYGRKAAGVPSLTIMAVGCLLLSFARDAWHATLASALLGIGNALSSGIVQTVGQDNAPVDPRSRGAFLGLYKVLTDCGTFLGPLVVGCVANAAGLNPAAQAIAAVTCGCALWYAAMRGAAPRPAISGPSIVKTFVKRRAGDVDEAESENKAAARGLIVQRTDSCASVLELGAYLDEPAACQPPCRVMG